MAALAKMCHCERYHVVRSPSWGLMAEISSEFSAQETPPFTLEPLARVLWVQWISFPLALAPDSWLRLAFNKCTGRTWYHLFQLLPFPDFPLFP